MAVITKTGFMRQHECNWSRCGKTFSYGVADVFTVGTLIVNGKEGPKYYAVHCPSCGDANYLTPSQATAWDRPLVNA